MPHAEAASPRTSEEHLAEYLNSTDTFEPTSIDLSPPERALLVNALGEWQKAQRQRGMHTRILPALRFSQHDIGSLITDLLEE